jgi:hypothetical protein
VTTEVELRRFYVAACTERFLDARLFIRNVGTLEVDGRVFRSGIKGMSDVWGWLFRKPWPVPLEIELKNSKTRETPEQFNWKMFLQKSGVPYLQLRARVEESPRQTIDRWIEETAVWFTQLRTR